MKILHALPIPDLERHGLYTGDAKRLQEQHGHDVVFAYVGPPRPSPEGLTVAHFDEWIEKNRERVAKLDLCELERRFPHSNLWLAAVAERRLTDYSLLKGALGFRTYKLEDLNFLTKALVAFYLELFEANDFDLVIAQHPDNMHSVMLFEMCKSLGVRCVMLMRDYYWDQDSFYLFDDQHFRSSRLAQLYRKYRDNYEGHVAPVEEQLWADLSDRTFRDPGQHRKDLLPRSRLGKMVSNAVKGYFGHWSWYRVGHIPVEQGSWRRPFGAGVMALFRRMRNFVCCKWLRGFRDSLPDQPFAYFPLHYQPEAALLAAAPAYQHQLGVIHAISSCLPAGVVLAVKDHPRIGGQRHPDFYRELRRLPNVVLLKASVPTRAILERCDLVVTIRGTSGLQALLMLKPVLVLGRVYYDCMDSVIKVRDMNELPELLKRQLVFPPKRDPEDVRRDALAFHKAYLEIMQRRHREQPVETPEQKAASYAELFDRLFQAEFGAPADAPEFAAS
jgi:hypothetical protein